MTREVDLGLSKGRPTPQGLPDRLPAGDWGLESRLVRGSVSGSVLWRRGEWSRLLCGLLVLRVVIFPTSASLAKSFSTSEGKKRGGGGYPSQHPDFRVNIKFLPHFKQECLHSIYMYTTTATQIPDNPGKQDKVKVLFITYSEAVL